MKRLTDLWVRGADEDAHTARIEMELDDQAELCLITTTDVSPNGAKRLISVILNM